MQFLAGGGLIFALYAASGDDDDATAGGGAASDAAVVVNRTIAIGPADLQSLRETFVRGARREPTPEELGDAVETFVNEEMLYREGKGLGLDREDVVVRRRIIDKMTVLARPAVPTAEPNETELRAWFQRYPHRFRHAPRISFEQRFFDPKRRANAADDARRVLAKLGETKGQEAAA
ncbi:MAG TPA: hypothetical protein VGF45_07685, partial [Polyangia bacterium]